MINDKIVVLGGDGFCGWAASLRLSAAGYDVIIVDNFSRRDIDDEINCNSLTPITTMEQRIKTWRRETGKKLYFKRVDVAKNYHGLYDVLKKLSPGTIIHFAEQRAAPYSMKSPSHKRYTVNNNIMATHNILCAITDLRLDTHLIHLGTMGVYGYGTAGISIPEGYIKACLIDPITGNHRDTEIYYPSNPGSIYHMTKVLDTHLFHYYNKNDKILITDLHQGIVWGIDTPETMLNKNLVNRFDYDGDYGTVLNRFIMQAALNHPLTVYGTGGQKRAFIHVNDMTKCIQLVTENLPSNDRVRVLNQTTEQHNLMFLAGIVAQLTGAEIRLYDNPRNEAKENELVACATQIRDLGLDPIELSENSIMTIYELAKKHIDRAIKNKIITTSLWDKTLKVDMKGKKYGS